MSEVLGGGAKAVREHLNIARPGNLSSQQVRELVDRQRPAKALSGRDGLWDVVVTVRDGDILNHVNRMKDITAGGRNVHANHS